MTKDLLHCIGNVQIYWKVIEIFLEKAATNLVELYNAEQSEWSKVVELIKKVSLFPRLDSQSTMT